MHVFGRSIVFDFVPLIGNEPVVPHSLVSARLFALKPSTTQVENTGAPGAVATATTWTEEDGGLRKITFSAVTDSNPHSTDDYETYYVVINFKYEAGGPTVFVWQPIFIYRPNANTSRISTTYVDVLKVEPRLGQFFMPGQLAQYVEEAKTDIFRRLRGLGKERARLFNLEELSDACRLRAAALASMSLYSDKAVHWREISGMHDKRYEEVFAQSRPGFDIDADKDITPSETVSGIGNSYVIR